MARRRVKSQTLKPTGQLQNFSQADVLRNLGDLANVATLLEGEQGLDDVPDIRGTAQDFSVPENVRFPTIPTEQEVFQEQEGIPQGIELLANLAAAEAKEDELDVHRETEPHFSLPQTGKGDLQDPLEFIRLRIKEDPSLAEHLPQETAALLEQTEPQPEKAFIPSQEEEPDTGVLQAISDYFSPQKIEEQRTQNEGLIRQARGQEAPTPIDQAIPPAVQESIERGPIESISEEDVPTEGLAPVPGSIERVEADPKLQQTVKNLLNLKEGDVPKEAWEHAKMMENVLTKEEQNLNELERQYRSKLQRGDLSTFDKVALGMAIAVPVLIGLTYGKDAFFSSAGGALKGFGETLVKQGAAEDKVLEKIGAIQKERKGIEEKRASLKQELLKSVENPTLRKLLKNYDVINIGEGPNGEPQLSIGRDAIQIGNDLGISAKDEDGILWYDANLLRDDDDVKNFKSSVKDGREAISKIKDANKTVDDVVDMFNIIKEQNPSAYSALVQYIQPSENSLFGFVNNITPQALQGLTLDVVGEDGQTRTVKALPLIKQKITALQDVYNKEYLGGNRLTSNLLKHWQDIFPDPSAISSWLKSDFNTMVQQAQNFKNTLNQRAVENLVGEGFLREPITKVFPVSGNDILQTTTLDMQDIARNPEKYRAKVKKK